MLGQSNSPTPVPAIVVFDIDGVVRDVGGSYRRALADTVEQYTNGAYRPSQTDIDDLKAEGIWNNDWEASQEFIQRHFQAQGTVVPAIDYAQLVAFFQSRYRGPDPQNWTGYICQEPLLVTPDYFASLTQAGIPWGFFSGATRASATYVLEHRLGLQAPLLIAMEDAPGKPDPTGLLQAAAQLNATNTAHPVLYVGDTVADLYAVQNASQVDPTRQWIGVGILPPHVQTTPEQAATYADTLKQAGAAIALPNMAQLTPALIQSLVDPISPTPGVKISPEL